MSPWHNAEAAPCSLEQQWAGATICNAPVGFDFERMYALEYGREAREAQ
jgi:hypothetical protein